MKKALRLNQKTMPLNNKKIRLTNDRLIKSATINGGYTKKQLALLGINWPPKKQWKKDLINTVIPLQLFIDFVVASGNDSAISQLNKALNLQGEQGEQNKSRNIKIDS